MKPTSNPTQRQIARLYTLAGQAELNHDEVIGQLRAAYGIQTTKGLTLLQYEEFCAWLQGRIGARSMGDAKPPAREGQIWQHAQVAKTLDIEWPGLGDGVREKLADVLDDFRLYRSSGRIAAGVLRQTIQRIARCGPELVEQACDVWLSRYRERNEAYFLGILRRLRRDAKSAGALGERATAMKERELAEEMERYGWAPVGRLPDGTRVFHAKSTGAYSAIRAGKWAAVTREEIASVIRGPDQ